LENALYIPSYQQDISSVQAATEKGATVKFCPDGTVFDICKNGKLYYLNSIVNNTSENCNASEWHRILGHCNCNDILKLELIVDGMKITEKSEFQCDICTIGRMTQSFNSRGMNEPLKDLPWFTVICEVLLTQCLKTVSDMQYCLSTISLA
jgi:hypothetical protein